MAYKTGFLLAVAGGMILSGCGRLSTPSTMNTAPPQLTAQTQMQQMPVAKVSDAALQGIADNYARYGDGALKLSLAYDPKDRHYSPVKAFADLSRFKDRLSKLGVRNIRAETVASPGTQPELLIAYDQTVASAPAGCRNMPGFDDGMTVGEMGDYKFGCTSEAMLAKQIYRPADLMGNGTMDPADGRRAAQTVDYYRQVTADEAEGQLKRLERSDVGGN